MKASTLFAITVALLIGLSVAITARMAGFFDSKPEAKPAPVKKRGIPILVAAHNLFEGQMLQSRNVRVRLLRRDELEHYRKHRDQYLPALPLAASLRVADTNISTDQPILKPFLQDLSMPKRLSLRLLPHMRAVNLSVGKDQSAGGLIQVGDWVDIHLKSGITGPDGIALTRTATLARNVRVIAKRNSLWPIYAPLPENRPVHYTLEANVYRAAFLEYAKDKGLITIVPLPAMEQDRLEAMRKDWLAAYKVSDTDVIDITPPSFSDPDSPEYKDEDLRVMAFFRGEQAVGEEDLVRIFNLKPPARLAPQPQPLTVEQFTGVRRGPTTRFSSDGQLMGAKPKAKKAPNCTNCSSPSGCFRFNKPGAEASRRKR